MFIENKPSYMAHIGWSNWNVYQNNKLIGTIFSARDEKDDPYYYCYIQDGGITAVSESKTMEDAALDLYWHKL